MKYCTLVDSGTGRQREEEGAAEMERYDLTMNPIPHPLVSLAGRWKYQE